MFKPFKPFEPFKPLRREKNLEVRKEDTKSKNNPGFKPL
jgi:hypothetical protein